MVRGRVSAALAPLLRPHLPVRPTGAARCFSSGWTGDENQHPTFTHANPHPGHPSVPGSWLVGTWRGEGKGMYPTMKDFTYTEQITFWSVPGLRYLFYTQNTWNPARSYAPFHAESGFLRIQGPPAAPVPQEDTADDGVPTKPSPRPLQHGSGSGTVRCEFILAQPNGRPLLALLSCLA
ncbi:hypothetical protein DFJ74DRAFT_393260 [Hyaloraphidium curvatum]|nr:hypothetical protein DFJ74DRAFT_393260 [Hyaloraphidium curvatum]